MKETNFNCKAPVWILASQKSVATDSRVSQQLLVLTSTCSFCECSRSDFGEREGSYQSVVSGGGGQLNLTKPGNKIMNRNICSDQFYLNSC